MAKNKQVNYGIVYSTNPDLIKSEENDEIFTEPPAMQPLKIKLDTKQRGGKAVTLVLGFIGATGDAEELGKKLKAFCGTGGTVKENEILVQGDNREKVLAWLQKNGYKLAKKF
jgi:translation initiation factor 1